MLLFIHGLGGVHTNIDAYTYIRVKLILRNQAHWPVASKHLFEN